MVSRIITNVFFGFALFVVAVPAQTKLAFEVATVKPAAPIDQARMLAAIQAGGKVPFGANVGDGRAEYRFLALKDLIALAYGVKPYQISGPDWMGTARFDIVAKMPEGSSKADANQMLQSLLEERFKVAVHRSSAEHPVLAIVVGKGGPKLKASSGTPVAIDESVPLKPGEMKSEGPDGEIRVSVDMSTGSAVVNTGTKGKMAYKVNPASQSMHLEFSMVTLSGFADMLTQLFTQLSGGKGSQIVDMTGIQGNYEASLDVSLADLMNMARSMGMNVPPAGPGVGNQTAGSQAEPAVASDPTGSTSLTDAVQSLGLKLESRKATVEQLVVDRAEKTPTEN
ncbi:MAG TPA: TIGR03435 family protein [Bryobacteraceae bacterium]|jgi:uncharacterized protein (TIGR03435 family)|nr:TIGR03435 family protein [Bryobacteraceae bacterium]